MHVSRILSVYVFLCLSGCAGSDGGGLPSPGADGSGGSAGGGGDLGMGGAGGVGLASGGVAGAVGGGAGSTGTGGAGNPSGHCTPGTFYEDPIDTYASGNVVVCYGYPSVDGGISVSDAPGVRSIKLPGSMAPGQEYSFSIEIVASGAPNTEIWTSSTECGVAEEKLWAGSMPAGTFCTTLRPTKPSKYILLVWRLGGGQHRSVTLCPGVACPR